MPTYPNVPDAPGVPPVARNPAQTDTTDGAVGVSGSGVQTNAASTATWGVFALAGASIAAFDAIVSVEPNVETQIPNYPVEGGGFATYNKTIKPTEVHLVATTGGTLDARRAVYKIILAAVVSTDLFNIVTPEATYSNVNLLSVRRMSAADRGATMLTLELLFEEVRQTAVVAFTNTKDPSGAAVTQGGAVQATAVSPAPTGATR